MNFKFNNFINFNLLFSITGKKYFFYFIGIILLIIFASLVDVLAISLIYPILDSLTNENEFTNSKIFYFFNNFINLNNLSFFNFGIIILFFLSFIKIISSLSLSYFGQKFSLAIHNKVSTFLFDKYLNKDYIYFTQNSSASLIRNILTEVSNFTNGILNSFINFLTEFILLIFFVSLAMIINFKLTFYVIFLIIILSLIVYFFTLSKIKSSGIERFNLTESKINDVTESLENIKQIKLLNAENIFLKNYDKNNSRANKKELIFYFFKSIPKNFLEFVVLMIIVSFLYFMKVGNYSISKFIPMIGTFALLSFRMIPSFTRITVSFQQFSFYKKSAEIIFKELNTELSKKNQNKFINTETNINFEDKITFNKIIYNYQKNDFELLIDYFEINKNSYIGIKGKSGSGKTTFINLLSGLLSPIQGKIKIDEFELNKHNKKYWFQKIGFLPQEVTLINDTILNNVIFGKENHNIDIKFINQIFERLSLESLSSRLKDPIFKVGEKGSSLSGGERQRLGLARALYRKPQLLILDEPTSSIDDISSKKIIELLNSLENTTKVVISHKSHDLKFCDNIYELDNGLIIKQ